MACTAGGTAGGGGTLSAVDAGPLLTRRVRGVEVVGLCVVWRRVGGTVNISSWGKGPRALLMICTADPGLCGVSLGFVGVSGSLLVLASVVFDMEASGALSLFLLPGGRTWSAGWELCADR